MLEVLAEQVDVRPPIRGTSAYQTVVCGAGRGERREERNGVRCGNVTEFITRCIKCFVLMVGKQHWICVCVCVCVCVCMYECVCVCVCMYVSTYVHS